MSLVLRVCSSRHPAAEVLPADEARAAGRHRHAGGLPVERRREFQKAHLRFRSLWTAFSRSGPSLKRSEVCLTADAAVCLRYVVTLDMIKGF